MCTCLIFPLPFGENKEEVLFHLDSPYTCTYNSCFSFLFYSWRHSDLQLIKLEVSLDVKELFLFMYTFFQIQHSVHSVFIVVIQIRVAPKVL